MEAAKDAAKRFVDGSPRRSGSASSRSATAASSTQQPTDSTRRRARRHRPAHARRAARRSAKGIFTVARRHRRQADRDRRRRRPSGDLDNVDIGYFGSAAIVLLSDGENTAEPDPLAVAELASMAGVHVYPIGIGSPEGTVVEVDGFSVATALDEAAARPRSPRSPTAPTPPPPTPQALTEVYDTIDLRSPPRHERTEVTGLLAGVAALLLFVGAALSLAWFGRVV